MIKQLILIVALLFATALMPAAVYAEALGGIDCSDGNNAQSAVCNDKAPAGSNPISGPDGVLIKIVKVVSYVAGAAAIIILLVSSIQFITAGGDANKAAGARRTIINTIIGVAVIVLAATFITYIVNRL